MADGRQPQRSGLAGQLAAHVSKKSSEGAHNLASHSDKPTRTKKGPPHQMPPPTVPQKSSSTSENRKSTFQKMTFIGKGEPPQEFAYRKSSKTQSPSLHNPISGKRPLPAPTSDEEDELRTTKIPRIQDPGLVERKKHQGPIIETPPASSSTPPFSSSPSYTSRSASSSKSTSLRNDYTSLQSGPTCPTSIKTPEKLKHGSNRKLLRLRSDSNPFSPSGALQNFQLSTPLRTHKNATSLSHRKAIAPKFQQSESSIGASSRNTSHDEGGSSTGITTSLQGPGQKARRDGVSNIASHKRPSGSLPASLPPNSTKNSNESTRPSFSMHSSESLQLEDTSETQYSGFLDDSSGAQTSVPDFQAHREDGVQRGPNVKSNENNNSTDGEDLRAVSLLRDDDRPEVKLARKRSKFEEKRRQMEILAISRDLQNKERVRRDAETEAQKDFVNRPRPADNPQYLLKKEVLPSSLGFRSNTCFEEACLVSMYRTLHIILFPGFPHDGIDIFRGQTRVEHRIREGMNNLVRNTEWTDLFQQATEYPILSITPVKRSKCFKCAVCCGIHPINILIQFSGVKYTETVEGAFEDDSDRVSDGSRRGFNAGTKMCIKAADCYHQLKHWKKTQWDNLRKLCLDAGYLSESVALDRHMSKNVEQSHTFVGNCLSDFMRRFDITERLDSFDDLLKSAHVWIDRYDQREEMRILARYRTMEKRKRSDSDEVEADIIAISSDDEDEEESDVDLKHGESLFLTEGDDDKEEKDIKPEKDKVKLVDNHRQRIELGGKVFTRETLRTNQYLLKQDARKPIEEDQ